MERTLDYLFVVIVQSTTSFVFRVSLLLMVTLCVQRDHELRGSRGGHMELRSTQAQKQAAAEAREQYREAQRANKKRIEDSLQNRKSLIERHDTVRGVLYTVSLSVRVAVLDPRKSFFIVFLQ